MLDVANPRQAILVTTRGTAELLGRKVIRDNIFTLTWHTPLSFEPEMYGISVGKNRFSYKLLKDSKVFAVNFMPHELKEKVLFCGRASGSSVDKFEKTGLTKEECTSIDCCRIKESCAYLECEVVEEVEVGDHVFFVGKVLKNATNNDKKRPFFVGKDQFTSTI
jgi:flavin reductase (DIM6/NTAB) family NADH-FMN oxidoreductase RutF